jgi:hypothetical protein
VDVEPQAVRLAYAMLMELLGGWVGGGPGRHLDLARLLAAGVALTFAVAP